MNYEYIINCEIGFYYIYIYMIPNNLQPPKHIQSIMICIGRVEDVNLFHIYFSDISFVII